MKRSKEEKRKKKEKRTRGELNVVNANRLCVRLIESKDYIGNGDTFPVRPLLSQRVHGTEEEEGEEEEN